MKPVFLAVLLCFCISFSSFGQESQSGDLVIIRTLEYRKGYSGGIEPVIHITEPDGTYRLIELEGYKKVYLKENSKNQRLIHEELKKYLNDGYKIISHSKGNSDIVLWYENYILYRE